MVLCNMVRYGDDSQLLVVLCCVVVHQVIVCCAMLDGIMQCHFYAELSCGMLFGCNATVCHAGPWLAIAMR